MPRNFLIRTIEKEDLRKTRKSPRVYKISRPYDKVRQFVFCIKHNPHWFITNHFKNRMEQRNITYFDVFKTLRFGESVRGVTYYEGSPNTIHFDRKSRIIILASGNGEVLITCYRAEDDNRMKQKIQQYSHNIKQNSVLDEKKAEYQRKKFQSKTVWKDENSFGNFIKIA